MQRNGELERVAKIFLGDWTLTITNQRWLDDPTTITFGTGFPATGKKFETVSPNIARFRDERVVEHWAEQGMISMLGQIGVLPMGG